MRKILCFTLLVVCCLQLAAQPAPYLKTKTTEKFDAYIQNAMKLWKTPGLSIVVVKDKQVLFEKGYGVKDVNTQAAFTPSTLSICASTTKAMTAVCMGMLVDAGKVSWSDKVSDVYPALKLYDNYANSEITIKDLFTHNTGLGNADFLWLLNYGIDSIIHQMRYIQPAYSFRSSFIYQNLMYMVAGEVIHKVSGKPWNEFIKDSLFARLGMNRTFPSYDASLSDTDHITTHVLNDDSTITAFPVIDFKSVDAAGGVWSCADDIKKWVMFMLDSTKINGKPLLKPETYATLFQPQSIVTASEFYPTVKFTKSHWTTYGIGWFQEDYKGRMVQFHTGSLDGAVAIIGLIPDENFGIYIFANMDHTEIRHALMYKAMDLFVFNDDTIDWSKNLYAMYKSFGEEGKKAEAASDSARVQGTKPSLALTNYTGKYSNEIYGNADVQPEGDSLVIKLPGNADLHLQHWNYDTFMGNFDHKTFGKGPVTFNLTSEGKVKEFVMMGITYNKSE